ncbi:hypothetical protein [Agriterribacter sp.]|uniref:hypothetical protein n=1 Tax=Agriterribacter sp. TaxID=2821509 RepID=UPI002CAA8D6B|nr:hypothetical protein [Agriterribacter sp.]HRO47680.1 hypothetical protein [Agriterribacter sp.]HRQ17661.1 hypothetical protein [Agriterribacter sp.]
MMEDKYDSSEKAIYDFDSTYGGKQEVSQTLDSLLLNALCAQDHTNTGMSAEFFLVVRDLKVLLNTLLPND